MTDEKKEKVDLEEQADALKAAGVAPSDATASGVAVSEKGRLAIGGGGAEHFGEPGAGAEERGEDTILNPGKAIGGQLEPAIMTPGGSIPANTIPSPSGPVPSGVITDPRARAEAERRVTRSHTDALGRQRNSRFRLSEEEVNRLSPAALRAVGSDRGYYMPDGGRRSIRNAFIQAQKDDETLLDPEEGVEATRMHDRQPIVVPGMGTAAAAPLRTTTGEPVPADTGTPPKGGPPK